MYLSYIILFLFFISVTNPFYLSIILIMITLNSLFYLFDSNLNHWASFLVCLIYLGGVLVLVLYISSLIPNNMPSMIYNYFLSFVFILFLLTYFFDDLNVMYSLIFGKSKMVFMITSSFNSSVVIFLIVLIVLLLWMISYLIRFCRLSFRKI